MRRTDSLTYVPWQELSEGDLVHYKNLTDVSLGKIPLNHALPLCNDPNCRDTAYIAALDSMYNDVTDRVQESSEQNNHNQPKQIPGWNDYCREMHAQVREPF